MLSCQKTPREGKGLNSFPALGASFSTSASSSCASSSHLRFQDNRVSSLPGGSSPRGFLFSLPEYSPPCGGILSDGGGSGTRGALGSGPLVTNEREVAIAEGSCGCRCCRHRNRGSQALFPPGSSNVLQGFSPCERHYERGEIPYSQTLCEGLGAEGHLDKRPYPSRGLFQSSFLRQQKEWEVQTDFRSFSVKHLCNNSLLCNGDIRQDLKSYQPDNVGDILGCHRRISDCSDSQRVSGIFLFHPGWRNLYVFTSPVWLDNSALGLYQSHETDKRFFENERSYSEFIHRRFLHSGCDSSPLCSSHFLDREALDLARVPGELRKIFPDPSAISRISGYSTGLEDPHDRSAFRQGLKDSVLLSSGFGVPDDNTERVGIVGGPLKFCSSTSAARKNAFDSSDQMDESVLQHSSQRRSFSHQSRIGEGFASLPRCQVFGNPNVLSSSNPIPGFNNGRLRLRLEWGGCSLQDTRLLDALGVFQVHQSEGTNGCVQNSVLSPGLPSSQNCQNPHRQYGSLILFEENGFSSFGGTQRSCKGFSFIVSRTQYIFRSCPHFRMSECSCRPGFEGKGDPNRMVLGSRHIRVDLPSVSMLSSGRPFCYEGEFSVSSLCLSLPGRRGFASRCPRSQFRLEQLPLCLRLPSAFSDGEGHREDLSVSRDNDSDRSFVSDFDVDFPIDSEGVLLDPSSPGPFSVPGGSSGDCSSGGRLLGPLCVVPPSDLVGSSVRQCSRDEHSLPSSSFSFEGFSPVALSSPIPDPGNVSDWFSSDDLDDGEPRGPQPEVSFEEWVGNLSSRVDVWVEGLVASGIDRDVSLLITDCHKDSTKKQYQHGWLLWLKWCYQRGVKQDDVLLSTIINFLGRKFIDDDRACSTVKNYFYAIRDPVKHLYNIDIFNCFEIQKLFAAIWRLKPGIRGMALMPSWSLEDLLNYLNSPHFEPLQQADKFHKFVKTVILILLATGRRICEIAAMTSSCSFLPNGEIKFYWFEGFLAKAESHLSQWSSIPPKIVPISAEDRRLCPVRAFNIFYSDRMAPVYEGGMWPHGKIDLSYLVKNTVYNSFRWAHPEVPDDLPPRIRCHDFRKLACSYSRKFLKGTWKDLCDWVGTKIHNTLESHYIRDVPRVNGTFQVPLGTILPDSEICNVLRED